MFVVWSSIVNCYYLVHYIRRTAYTLEEDVSIITYLITSNRYSQAMGIKVYRDMELLQVSCHRNQALNWIENVFI